MLSCKLSPLDACFGVILLSNAFVRFALHLQTAKPDILADEASSIVSKINNGK